MRAMILERAGTDLVLRDRPLPIPAAQQLRVRVEACGVCRTDLHVRDGELTNPKLPLVLGHEIVGIVDALGSERTSLSRPNTPGDDYPARVAGRSRRGVLAPPPKIGDRVGIPWLGWTCGQCQHCSHQRENLCERGRYVGYQMDGGYAEFVLAWSDYCIPLPETADAAQLAPLLCAGLIGYRTYRLSWSPLTPSTGNVQSLPKRVGIYGFGAAAHVIAQVVKQDGGEVFAFTRPGDGDAQRLALDLGATWAGGSNEETPEPLDAALIFAPVGSLVPQALRNVRPGGTVVCGGIHMSDIPSFPYADLWQERVLRSVANLTRKDAHDFFARIEKQPVRAEVETFALEDANEALTRLRDGRIRGAAVLLVS